MEIWTLTGPSGTGKSFRAIDITQKYNIDGVIDDGLFIYRGTVVEGESAKLAATKVGAIKAAIFNDPKKAETVRKSIRKKSPDSILVLGTSDEMTDLIIERLGLSDGKQEIHRIYIEDITTEDERSEAKTQRENYGKHVIPAPALELKRSFAGYFLDSLGLFKGRFRHQNEKTVVRPSFSYIGEYVLSEKVISDIVKLVAEEDKAISGVIMVTQDPSPGNYVVNVAVRITSACSLWDDMQRFQQKVKDAVEQMTAFNVAEVNVEVRGIEYHGRY